MPGTTETASRLNFNPDWMAGGGNNGAGAKNAKYPFSTPPTNNNNNDAILAPPKLSKNRYSREELLVMFNLSAPAPSRLKEDFADFYVDPSQNPVCMAPYTDIEQQLLVHGINSSKAMSKVDRYAGGAPHPPPNVGAPPTTNSRWSNLHSSSSAPSGPNSRGFGRGAGVDSFGGGGGARQTRGFGISGPTDRNVLPSGLGRGRGADTTRLGPTATPARPGETTNLQLNPRAQGLYDPNNPKDRPRQRLKSKTDENEDVGVKHNYAAQQHNQVQQSASAGGGGLPEWVEEDDDYAAVDPNKKVLIKTGSFDETGNFRRETADQAVSGEKEQPATRRIPQTFSSSTREKVAETPSAKVDLPAAASLSLVETNSSSSSTVATAAEQPPPRFLQFLKTPSTVGQQQPQQEKPPEIQRSAEGMRILQTPGSSTTNSKTEDDVLSDLHTRAEGMIKSVFTDESEATIRSKFNRLSVTSQQISTIPMPPLAPPTLPVALDHKRKMFLDSTWYYKDPSDTCQGPFSSEMMANWFAAGYFTMQLMIRPAFESNFTTLGDMIKRVGGIPFQQSPPANNVAAATPVDYTNYLKTSGFPSSCNTGANLDIFPQPLINNSIPGQPPSTIWDVYNNSGTNYGLNPVNKQTENCVISVDKNVMPKESSSLPTKETIERDLQKMLERLKADDKKRQDEEMERQKALQAEMSRMLEEERKKMLELQSKLEREAQEKERLLKEAEAKLKAQLEIQQQQKVEENVWNNVQSQKNATAPANVWTSKQKPAALPARSTDVEAWLQSPAATQENKVDKKAAKIRKEEERRQRLEQEEQLRREKEEKIKEEERIATEAKIKAEEEERKRIHKENMEKELKEQHRRLLDEERRKNKKIVPANDGGPAWGAGSRSRPNNGAGPAAAARQSATLRDIQMEEERQMLAERRQNMEQELLNKPASPAQQSGAWGRGGGAIYASPPAAFRENVAPTSTAVRTTAASKNAWSAVDTIHDPEQNDAEALFQDECRIRQKSPMKPMTFDNKVYKRQEKPSNLQQSKNATAKKSQPETTKSSNEAVKRLLTQPNDEFAVWCIEQMKRLNKEIADSEASVFIEFLRNVPDLEVKDYVLGYIPETPATNKFLNDFIEKRTRLRISGSTNAPLNEWSTVNKQNHGNMNNSGNDQQQQSFQQHNNSNSNNNNNKAVQSKKKGKKGGGGGAVLDHAVLGFKATGDPNRVNVGEIDSPM